MCWCVGTDLVRRSVDVPEKKYLMSRGVVTETQSNMGIIHTHALHLYLIPHTQCFLFNADFLMGHKFPTHLCYSAQGLLETTHNTFSNFMYSIYYTCVWEVSGSEIAVCDCIYRSGGCQE